MKQIDSPQKLLRTLGERLRTARLGRNDTMAAFAERIGMSERTVRAMERGLPTVQIGAWLNALWALNRLEELDLVLKPRDSLLDRARNERASKRQRASRRIL
jgi:transcriptional regulator with XRE-family HTH domain